MAQAGGTKCLKAPIWLGNHLARAANGKSPISCNNECLSVRRDCDTLEKIDFAFILQRARQNDLCFSLAIVTRARW